MKPSGYIQIEEAKKDGRWERAYSPQKEAVLPADFMTALKNHKKAELALKTLNKSNVYSIILKIETAQNKQQRKKRIESIIELLEKTKRTVKITQD